MLAAEVEPKMSYRPVDAVDQGNSLVAALSALRDPQARLSWLVEWARQQPSLPAELRQDRHRVEGCQVRIWWIAELRDGHCEFRTDSDAVTLKALAGFLAHHYSGRQASEIVAGPRSPLKRLGLYRQLAESRRATLQRIEDQVHAWAGALEPRGD